MCNENTRIQLEEFLQSYRIRVEDDFQNSDPIETLCNFIEQLVEQEKNK